MSALQQVDQWQDLKRRLAEATLRFDTATDIEEKVLLGADVRELERLVEIAAETQPDAARSALAETARARAATPDA